MPHHGSTTWSFIGFILQSFLCVTLDAQRLSTRQCTASDAVRASRAANASNANAAAACASFCSNSNSQLSGALYPEYCGSITVGTLTYTTTGSCGVTSYFANAPLITGGQTVVPTLTRSGSNLVVVPCSYGGTAIPSASLGISNPGSTTPFYVNQQVIASSTSDFTPGYVAVNPTTGALTTSTTLTPGKDVTQTIAFTLAQRGTAVDSNTVTITFVFQSCQLQLSGPDGPVTVCNQPPATNTPPYSLQYPITFTTTNAPAGVTLICDLPSDAPGGSSNGGATLAEVTSTDPNTVPGTGGVYAPEVVSDSTIDPTTGNPASQSPGYDPYLTVSYHDVVTPAPPNGVCIYGANPPNPTLATGCQFLRFSVSPDPSTPTPYFTGFKIVQVCYSGAACSPPQPDPVPAGP